MRSLPFQKEAPFMTPDESSDLPGGWQAPAPRGLFLSTPFLAQPVKHGSVLYPGLQGSPEKLRALETVLITLPSFGTISVLWAHFTLKRLIACCPKSLCFHTHGEEQLIAECH